MPKLAGPPMPGPMGEQIFAEVSAQAWGEWQELQTMLINEKHLSLIDPATRKYLSEQMWLYLRDQDGDRPEGFTPPNIDHPTQQG